MCACAGVIGTRLGICTAALLPVQHATLGWAARAPLGMAGGLLLSSTVSSTPVVIGAGCILGKLERRGRVDLQLGVLRRARQRVPRAQAREGQDLAPALILPCACSDMLV